MLTLCGMYVVVTSYLLDRRGRFVSHMARNLGARMQLLDTVHEKLTEEAAAVAMAAAVLDKHTEAGSMDTDVVGNARNTAQPTGNLGDTDAEDGGDDHAHVPLAADDDEGDDDDDDDDDGHIDFLYKSDDFDDDDGDDYDDGSGDGGQCCQIVAPPKSPPHHQGKPANMTSLATAMNIFCVILIFPLLF